MVTIVEVSRDLAGFYHVKVQHETMLEHGVDRLLTLKFDSYPTQEEIEAKYQIAILPVITEEEQ